ncbi:Dyp-type peroxidase [Umboniibacter marinipuniceus]|uniref:Putative iron-dependent peroxidase n=1 Tax=Umboniibacter marinipuniceus TaxID=569599 RepID=A0A3M0A1X9_9GAMM|nr:Dyp-type peroxidase [Umboniibacter marinipuniceus]RMA78820.1 putative iron-dependent peroxidase [Umboniibacter marinipuniceus]
MEPQQSIFSDGHNHRLFLEFSLNESPNLKTVKAALRALRAQSEVEVVVAFGRKFSRLLEIALPNNFHDFASLESSSGAIAPATQNDLFVWLQGEDSAIFEVSFQLVQALQNSLSIERELNGFDYRESKDLMSFEDGSANPKGSAIQTAALVPEGEAGEGGSIVLTQQWVHKLAKFFALTPHEQSAVIGRDKATNEELSSEDMPNNAHVARTDVDLDGVPTKVWRRSSPYGTPSKHGLYFLSFSCDQRRHQLQLDSMYGLTGDGVSDHILAFSDAVSGSYYFAPSETVLREMLS